jgi:Protein of unknown function (DUF2971)
MKCNLDSVENWIDSYFKSLAKINTETEQSEVLALKRSNFPKALYRYRSLERLAYTLEELRDGYVFLSNPADFNDPYDSALSASYEQVQKQLLEKIAPEYGYDPNTESKFFQLLGEKEKEEWSIHKQHEQQAYESLMGGLLSLFYGPSAFRGNQDLFSSFRDLVRVSCFTTNPNSVVMWSHYANQHKGICVEFSGSSMLSSTKILEVLHPVRYTEELFHFFSFFNLKIDVDQVPNVNFDGWPILAACHKSKEWRYEKEWRLVSVDPANRKVPKFFLDSYGIKPSRIILGHRIDRADQAAIQELAQKISVPVIKGELAKDRFEIKF